MAARGVNKVIIIGNLGSDPEVRYMPNGVATATLSVATSESWRDKTTGEMKENTEWHRVVLYRKLAEIAGEYLRKGTSVYIEGKLKTRKWTDQEGKDHYTTEILVDQQGRMEMLGRGSQGSRPAPQASSPGTPSPANEPPMDFDDDIPFMGHGYGVCRRLIYAIS